MKLIFLRCKKIRKYIHLYKEIKGFIGCYLVYNEKEEIIDFKKILPQIPYFYDELIGYMESSIEKHELYFYKQK